eukprot:TRINITY_DN4888_c0_g1_i2.p1 TRINITY_DN4888_c0_g1~~TRINITY_DN4888_c0_g1_i2.p1  ORF type:complete len:108 (-),score=16.80 TRINITY_DN4888_c0_g1_i2:25-348(-)
MCIRDRGKIVKSLEVNAKALNLEKLSTTMDAFDKTFEDLEVQGTFVQQTMNNATATSTSQSDVDALIMKTAEAHGLDVAAQFGATPTMQPTLSQATTSNPNRSRALG